MTVHFTGYAYVSHDNTWTGGFVSVNCVNGTKSSFEDCIPCIELKVAERKPVGASIMEGYSVSQV